MADTTRVGTGTVVTMGTTNYNAEIIGISHADETVPVIDVSHMGTTGSRSKITGELIDHGSFDVEIHISPSKLDTMKTALGTIQAISIKFPLVTGETNNATAAGSGAITAHNYTIPLEDKIVGGFTVTWTGAVTYTDPS